MAELEQIEGTVEDIIYENEDNGYTVFELSGGGVVTVVCGIVGELHAGESVVCRGRYENHATYGRQFHAQECETDMPKDLEAVYAFLASKSLPYIGAKTADKIIDLFGAEALEVIANDPARLTQVPGISADKADRIQQEFKRMFGMRELIAYLAQFEISPRRAMEVFRTFGPGAMQAIAANPYLLCGEPLQLDFRHADSIAQYYHMEGDCAQRLEAALLRTLRHNAGNGHTCLPRTQLLETAAGFIHQPPEKLAAALDECIRTEELRVKLFDGTPYIYLPDLLEAEEDIAARLAMLTKRGKNTAHGLDKNIQILELTQGFAYAPLQKEAIRKAMTENCLVLTGGPGTGKTTTVNAILQLLEDQAERVALCAPTGRAAKRLSELTGRKASTIHRLLEVDYTGGVVSFIHNDKNLLKCDVVILDEMSMVDVKLFQALIAALRYSCRIIRVGDADQLPSVGPGNILGEVIRSGLVPTVCLNEIFRQA
ncbi:MAG: AAA family ATPase, partial [Faecalibacterium sp.]|nr:AAA family ATPase [Faecalibacterium sp.]MDY5503402.1 AAA family ATPase [Faecalibacterium sp.]